MSKTYKRNCSYCNKYYKGFGKKYCTPTCYFKSLIGKSSGKKGKKLSEEIKEKISKTLKEKYKNGSLIHNMLNKNHTNKTKQKISKTLIGRKLSEETKKKMSKIFKGRKFSTEWRKNLSKSKKGKNLNKKHSKETKRKMRLSAIKRIEKNNGKMFPHFNKNSIFYFKKFDKENNTKGFYGKNEYQIKELGYWLDYINFDLKLIIEWDEKAHYNINGNLKDIQRQKEIQKYFSNFKFIRINEETCISPLKFLFEKVHLYQKKDDLFLKA